MGFLCGLDVRLARGVALWLGRGSDALSPAGEVRQTIVEDLVSGRTPSRQTLFLWRFGDRTREPNSRADEGLKSVAVEWRHRSVDTSS